MLTVLCPNCRHRFPAPGCCASSATAAAAAAAPAAPSAAGATSVTSATTSFKFDTINKSGTGNNGLLFVDALSNFSGNQQVTISTQCGIQSGGCLIQNNNATEVLLAPRVEVRSSLSGGGCLVQKRPEPADEDPSCISWEQCRPLLISEEQLRKSFEQAAQFQKSHSRSTTSDTNNPPIRIETPLNEFQNQSSTTTQESSSSCSRSSSPCNNTSSTSAQTKRKGCECRCCCYCRCCYNYSRSSDDEEMPANKPPSNCCNSRSNQCQASADNRRLARCCRTKETQEPSCNMETDKYSGDVRIQVNATVHLPSSTNSCTLNITTTTTTTASPAIGGDGGSVVQQQQQQQQQQPSTITRPRNNLNGGGIVNLDDISDMSFDNNTSNNANNARDVRPQPQQPSTPVSWLLPCSWDFVNNLTYSVLLEKDWQKLVEVRKTLQGCGWYYEGLSWQQSESLLKDAPIGRWLMRDSSDSRYTFAVSVQTARGPTSVRVFYCMGKFRLDAEPRLASTMPLFDCPIKMLEYYVEYSKQMDENRREVWVDYSGQVYSQIYLSDPLLKEVRSLAHLARIAVNRAGLEKEKERLPPLIKNYLAEYPYSL